MERTSGAGETPSGEQRYFIKSRGAHAPRLAPRVRGHGGVENRLPGRLEGVFGDDARRLRQGNAPAILTSLRPLGMPWFDQDPSSRSLAKKRRKAAWNDDFRAKGVFG